MASEAKWAWRSVKNGTRQGYKAANGWILKVANFATNDIFCNASTSCSIDFYSDPSCPIPTNVNATGCFPPCTTDGCDFVYRFSDMCPQLFCVHLNLTDYGLIFGLFFFVVGVMISCSCCICYFRCNTQFRRVMGMFCCSFRGRFTRIYDLDVEEGRANNLSRESLGQRSTSTTDASSLAPQQSPNLAQNRSADPPIYKKGKVLLSPVPEVQGEECPPVVLGEECKEPLGREEEEEQQNLGGIVNERFVTVDF